MFKCTYLYLKRNWHYLKLFYTINLLRFSRLQAEAVLNSMSHHALRPTSAEGSMCSAAAPLLWLSVSQTAAGGAALLPADATPGLRRSGAHQRFCGHLRRNPRNPDHSGDYSRNYGLNTNTDGFSCSRGGQHTWIYYLIPGLRMMAAADGSSSCGFWWIIGAPPLSRCRDSVWRTEDSCPGCHGGQGQRPVQFISLWILTEEQEYSGMFSTDERSCGS